MYGNYEEDKYGCTIESRVPLANADANVRIWEMIWGNTRGVFMVLNKS